MSGGQRIMSCSRAERTRTSDTRFRKPLLYPLSYSPIGVNSITGVKHLLFATRSFYNICATQCPAREPGNVRHKCYSSSCRTYDFPWAAL